MADKVQRSGRIEYIEPNSLFTDGPIQNGIPQPYENYSFSVNLRVVNGNRYDCGLPGSGRDILGKALEFSSDNGTLSFIDGTANGDERGYLTTNFTDISMNDPDTNTRECLGIESINIKYTSWYTPSVDIKFIDVRGASLMQPSEYEYYNNGRASTGKSDSNLTNSDFFKAFFSFPYPLFKLSVKGFYGKEVTYDLSVVSTNIEFNSQTGNFEVSANFIGYMYGMYADLPFPFVYLAPYIDLYGKNTWEEKKASDDFCYLESSSGAPGAQSLSHTMYTFPELRRLVKSLTENAEKVHANSKEELERKQLVILYDKIKNEVKPYYPPIHKDLKWWSWSKTSLDKEGKGYFFVPLDESPENNRLILTNFLRFSKALEEYNELAKNPSSSAVSTEDRMIKEQSVFSDIYKASKELSEKKAAATKSTAQSVLLTDYTDEEVHKLLDGHVVSLRFRINDSNKEKYTLDYISMPATGTSSSTGNPAYSLSNPSVEPYYADLVKEVKRRFDNWTSDSPISPKSDKKEQTLIAFSIDNIRYFTHIEDTMQGLKKSADALKAEWEKTRDIEVMHMIGLKPTIKNMFNMVFAHIDTFMSIFYNTLDRIRWSLLSSTDNSRKAENFVGGGITIDVNENTLKSPSSHGGKIPPFTMFYKEEQVKDSEDTKVVMVWPGSLEAGKNLEEVRLVEAIINATALDEKTYQPVRPRDNKIPLDGNLVPTNYYDIASGMRKNPYTDVLNEYSINVPGTLRKVAEVFILRCYFAFFMGHDMPPLKKARLIAELEAENVKRAFNLLGINPTQEFITELHMYGSNPGEFVKKIFSGDTPLFTTLSTYNELSYRWIKDEDSGTYLYPLGTFNPEILESAKLSAWPGGFENTGKFLRISGRDTRSNEYTCSLYNGGGFIEREFAKHPTGDFVKASSLFTNYGKCPKSIAGLYFGIGAFGKASSVGDIYKNSSTGGRVFMMPSFRKSQAGVTNIFMDPLYYAQESQVARAYLFLFGIPYMAGTDGNFFLPGKVENGDYPTTLLLREGAAYWREAFLNRGVDPINYVYNVKGSKVDALEDVERYDPRLGKKFLTGSTSMLPANVTAARKKTLTKYFLDWATGNSLPEEGAEATGSNNPFPALSFYDIERILGLWTENTVGGLTVKEPLSPENCGSAVTAQYASEFENGDTLMKIYDIGEDGKLGKTNGKLRTGVLMRNPADMTSVGMKAFISSFSDFYLGFDSVLDYANLDDRKTPITENAITEAVSSFLKILKEQNNISEERLKNNDGTTSDGVPKDEYEVPTQFKGDKVRLAIYIALKSLYDRWLCSRRRESWYFSCNPERLKTNGGGVRSDFSRFYYIDEFYHDSGMKVETNLSDVIDLLCKLGGFTEDTDEFNLAGDSILKILSTVAQKAKCSILTLPLALGLARNGSEDRRSSIEDVFKAFPYNDAVHGDDIETSFVVLYSSPKSSFLDVKDKSGKMGYKSDGFDIADTWGKIAPIDSVPFFADSGPDSFVVPSFGVTFAKQNQSFFKNVRLNMSEHQVTEYALKNTLMISYQNNRGPRETSVVGQDLYGVFSNYSYSCTVDMMGDAQISPLMYFQLNNIAMWKGAYMITSVQHSITVEGMQTTFTGVRQARQTVPYTDDELLTAPAPGNKSQDQEDLVPKVKEHDDNPPAPERPLDKVDPANVKGVVLAVERSDAHTSPKWINGLFSVRIYDNDGNLDKSFIDTGYTIEPEGVLNKRIENVRPEDMSVFFALPFGRYSKVAAEAPFAGEEYRDPNDGFFSFTEGRHLVVSDSKMGRKRAEIIPGVTDYSRFEKGGFDEVCLGGVAPVMLYPASTTGPVDFSKEDLKAESRELYAEVFRFVKRMREAGKPVTFLVGTTPGGSIEEP